MNDNAVVCPAQSGVAQPCSTPRCTAPTLGAKMIAFAMGLLDDLRELRRRHKNADRYERRALSLAISTLEQSRPASLDRSITSAAQPGLAEPDSANIEAAQEIVAANRNSPFFQRRYNRNVLNPPTVFSRDQFWKQMIVCLCTSVQPSGPSSRVSKFVREKPFALTLDICESQLNLPTYAETILHERGLRFGPKIGRWIHRNLEWLRNGGWKTAQLQFDALAQLPKGTDAASRIAVERTAAAAIMGRTGGLAGLAQSRREIYGSAWV